MPADANTSTGVSTATNKNLEASLPRDMPTTAGGDTHIPEKSGAPSADVLPAALAGFLPPVARWFVEALGTPTHAQALTWPSVRSGQNTLLLAPTGSGKTLAAFLVCLDELWRQPDRARGTKILYISPLKALNNDIQRNLEAPLAGITAVAQRTGVDLEPIRVAVRTGDTTAPERQKQIRKPPDILITTPESLHILLTSKGRAMLQGVTHVIVDEIHSLCPNKRGVFLSLLLERLEEIRRNADGSAPPLVRIGLSATQRPLSEVARYLGGYEWDSTGNLAQRPVNIVDAGIRKELDLLVVLPVEAFGPQAEKSVWPSIYRLIRELINAHRSTIVFANNRRAVEKITAWVNEESEIAKSHHGSVSLEKRRQTEEDLKSGKLAAVVATASLEMGIDMGAVDLVIQVESPGSVSRALQRVGRAGHVVGLKSKGRMIPKTSPDLLEMAVLTRQMKLAAVEPIRVPACSLDILCQQVVAMVAMEDWDVESLYRVVRRAAPYRDLTPELLEQTLELVSGRFRFGRKGDSGDEILPDRLSTLEALQPRISWDRIHHRLRGLPGSAHLSLVNGGAIPDTGSFGVYGPGSIRIGELDEEFVYERRVGDSFLLGTTAWRIEKIETDRVVVSHTEGELALLPFWRGEGPGRTFELGQALGEFLGEVEKRLDDPGRIEWLCDEFFLDRAAARGVCDFLTRQLLAASVIPNDRTILIESSRDPLGDWQVMILSPLGARFHLGLRLALESAMKAALGYRPKIHHHDDGVIIRFMDTPSPLLDLFELLDPENLEQQILAELAESPLFAIRFRQNASRALLLPRAQPGKRSPLWLQRLRGKDLLQVARKHPDFPIIVETYRECLADYLELEPLKDALRRIAKGEIKVVKRRAAAPCPFAGAILFDFTAEFLYQTDTVDPESSGAAALDRNLLEQILPRPTEGSESDLAPGAIKQLERRIRGLGLAPRSDAEMAETLRRAGDLAQEEVDSSMLVFLQSLVQQGEAVRIEWGAASERAMPGLWISAERKPEYEAAFFGDAKSSATGPLATADSQKQRAGETILARFLATHALVSLEQILSRYPYEREWAARRLEEWSQSGRAVALKRSATTQEWTLPDHLNQMRRSSLSLARREIRPVSNESFQRYLLDWQKLTASLAPEVNSWSVFQAVMDQLEGMALPLEVWENAILPARVAGYQPALLDRWCESGLGIWAGHESSARGVGAVSFHRRDLLPFQSAPPTESSQPLGEWPSKILAGLSQGGAAFVSDIALSTGQDPSAARDSLWRLAAHALITNDQVQVLRTGRNSPVELAAKKMRDQTIPNGSGRPGMPGAGRLPFLRSLRAGSGALVEGRWSAIAWGHPDIESFAALITERLLNRYGILSRQIVAHAGSPLSWKILYEILSRMELSGAVRRGYLVEGLEGAQFGLSEAVDAMQKADNDPHPQERAILLHSLDPANVLSLFAGEETDSRFLPAKRASNWIVSIAGFPVLGLENHGKDLSAHPRATPGRLALALKCLAKNGARLGLARGTAGRVSVETWNGEPVLKSPHRNLLQEAGFVSDLKHLTLYLTPYGGGT